MLIRPHCAASDLTKLGKCPYPAKSHERRDMAMISRKIKQTFKSSPFVLHSHSTIVDIVVVGDEEKSPKHTFSLTRCRSLVDCIFIISQCIKHGAIR